MHPELMQLLDADLRTGRSSAAGRRHLADACPRVDDAPVVAGGADVTDALRCRFGFWLVAAGLRLAMPRT
jgi:hypothetical protein